jgi:hypothetical protein
MGSSRSFQLKMFMLNVLKRIQFRDISPVDLIKEIKWSTVLLLSKIIVNFCEYRTSHFQIRKFSRVRQPWGNQKTNVKIYDTDLFKSLDFHILQSFIKWDILWSGKDNYLASKIYYKLFSTSAEMAEV